MNSFIWEGNTINSFARVVSNYHFRFYLAAGFISV